MNNINLTSLPQTENWVFALLLGLFFLLMFSIRLYPNLFYEDIRSLFRVKERSSIFSNPEGSDSRIRILFLIFAGCTIALYAYVILFEPGTAAFSFTRFLLFLTATFVFFILKYLLNRLLLYVFFDRTTAKIALLSYNNLLIFFGIILFPLLVISIFGASWLVVVAQILSVLACLLMVSLSFFKIFQIFYSKLLDSFYILLYLCTLEIIPIIVLIRLYQSLV